MTSKIFKYLNIKSGACLPARQGFTLIETLIAVLLLAMSIAGPLTIASKGLTATMVSKDQFIGFYLAQDAIEQVRFLRDSACLASGGGSTGCPVSGANGWLSGLNNCLTSVNPDGCYLDSLATNPASPVACSGTCPIMNYDSVLTVFNYNLAKPLSKERFIRTVKITNTTPDEAVVTVEVNWSDRAGITRVPIKVRENIFRWQ